MRDKNKTKKQLIEELEELRQRIYELETLKTQLKEAGERLSLQKKHLESLVNYSSLAIVTLDEKHNIISCNRDFEKLFQYKVAEILGKNLDEFIAGEEYKQEAKVFTKKSFTGATIHEEAKRKKKDGTYIDVELFGVPVVIYGKVVGIYGIYLDISERKRAEQALIERENELEIQTNNLEEVNTALRVLLKRREEDKTELEQKVLLNVKELVIPTVERLKKIGLGERQKVHINILESNLNDIISPFSLRLSSTHLNFTPAEIQVANLVRHGKTTKEIAEILNLSNETINSHRKNIRKKIGIKNKKASLRTHLLYLQNGESI